VSSSGPGLSGGGTNNRFNNIQIDGATEADLFGLGLHRPAGGQAGGKSIGLESVKEYQVLLSPYDVRQGNFSGALINAVTKSGANDFFGSVYGFGRNQSFARSRPYITSSSRRSTASRSAGPIVTRPGAVLREPRVPDAARRRRGNYVGRPRSRRHPGRHRPLHHGALRARHVGLGGGGQVDEREPADERLRPARLQLRPHAGGAPPQLRARRGRHLQPPGRLVARSFPLSMNGYASVGQERHRPAAPHAAPRGAFNEFIAGYTTHP
jgi:hypothetical protein